MAPSSAAAIDVIRFGFVEIVNAFHERIGIKDIKKYGSADVSFGVFRRLAHIEYHGSSVTLHGFLIFFNWQDCYSVIGMATDTKSQCRQKGCNIVVILCKDNANERNKSLLLDCRAQLIFYKNTRTFRWFTMLWSIML